MSIPQNPSGTLLVACTGNEIAARIERSYRLLEAVAIVPAEGLKWYEVEEVAAIASTAIGLHQELLTADECKIPVAQKVKDAAWHALETLIHTELVLVHRHWQAKGTDTSSLNEYFAFIAKHPLPSIHGPEAP